ncbi:NAD(P)/FAD-dependent oxidoreductase [Aquipuribacter nitratireducens]|uniref:NAD(P)/FAD-dependent oxidoreductase n=1 Tax=Aquipuribacter nitratireducens TaxID=650104 RepID=A0ABW0GKD2_9MICO
MGGHRTLSLWHEQVADAGDPLVPVDVLDGDTDADVCVVGAGYTGLWTAYYLLRARPDLRVVVLEQDVAGFGASGRNGGWCSALFPRSTSSLAARYGRERALALRRAMVATVGEVGRVVAEEGIECGWTRGGTVVVARGAAQERRAAAEHAEDTAFDGVDGVELLDATAARSRLAADGVTGGTYTPHCARVQPAALVRGLARRVRARGARVHEGTRVTSLAPGLVRTVHGAVRAPLVVRATEAWTARLPGSRRDVVPVYSLMVATEPLPAEVWDRVGLAARETFSEHRHLVVYGQRTADDRLVFGGRGAPYHFGSGIRPAFDRDERVFTRLRETLHALLPQVAGHAVTHAWGGPLGVPRDWHAAVGHDPSTGLAWAGGYVGDGVGTANLAGRTLADLLLGVDSDLTRLPWVQHRSRRWEPEPLRWAGVNAGLAAATLADAEERRTGRRAVAAPLLGRLTGG